LCFYPRDLLSPLVCFSLDPRDSLTPGACLSRSLASPGLAPTPGTRPSPSPALVSPTGTPGAPLRTYPRPASVSYASRYSQCSVFMHGELT
ncbi:hypothetical protein C0993_012722, partial [Termitomyces sp. T159_Od127]